MLAIPQSTAEKLPTVKVPTAKVATAIGGGLAVTFVLFAAMQQLIATKGNARAPVIEPPVVQLYEPVKDSEPEVRPMIPVRPELKPRELPKSTPQPVDNVNIGVTEFSIAGPGLPKGEANTALQHADREATPLVRVEPRYPVTAARDGINGWVRLGFTIDESGAVTDVVVLAAEPSRVFDREAITALKRWKYQPKQLDGKLIKQTGMQVQLDFNLDNS